jgi:hypothetical protein
MKDLIPLIIFFSIFFTSVILRVLASKNLLEEYSGECSNVILNTKGSWTIHRNMFNEKGKWYYITSNSIGILWVVYIIVIIAYNSF